MPNIGMSELLIILLFVLIFFGAKKIPEFAQSLGKGLREFRKAARDIQEEISEESKKIENKSTAKPESKT